MEYGELSLKMRDIVPFLNSADFIGSLQRKGMPMWSNACINISLAETTSKPENKGNSSLSSSCSRYALLFENLYLSLLSFLPYSQNIWEKKHGSQTTVPY